MRLDNPRENTTQTFSQAYYYPTDIMGDCWNFNTSNNGTCTITRFDTINKIVSGQFEFVGICSYNDYSVADSTVMKQITQGRFDLKFDVINE